MNSIMNSIELMLFDVLASRTLAFSVRRVSRQPRAFVVLTERTIPADLRSELLADGWLKPKYQQHTRVGKLVRLVRPMYED